MPVDPDDWLRRLILQQIIDEQKNFATSAANYTKGVAAEFLAGLRAEEPQFWKDMEFSNKKVASAAQGKIVEAYLQRKKRTAPYRHAEQNKRLKRYAGRQLEVALRDPALITTSGDGRGINFIDTDILDEKAPQWKRLNFGTRPAGRRSVREGLFVFKGGGPSAIGLKLNNIPPERPFRIPDKLRSAGFWSSRISPVNSGVFDITAPTPGAGKAFYILTSETEVDLPSSKFKGKKKRNQIRALVVRGKPTKGIQGLSFLQEGTQYINANLPVEIEKNIQLWIAKAMEYSERYANDTYGWDAPDGISQTSSAVQKASRYQKNKDSLAQYTLFTGAKLTPYTYRKYLESAKLLLGKQGQRIPREQAIIMLRYLGFIR